jgi:hypothetical protein
VREPGFWLQLAGIVVQIIGLAFSWYGFYRTWHEFAPQGENIRDWLTVPVRAAVRRLGQGRIAAWMRRVLGGAWPRCPCRWRDRERRRFRVDSW